MINQICEFAIQILLYGFMIVVGYIAVEPWFYAIRNYFEDRKERRGK